MSQPLLSICIPTYNRIGFLTETLDALMPQVTGNPDIEVLVNDNASEDDTAAKIGEYARAHNYTIDIKRNSSNIGSDANFKDVISRSHGKYIYLMGDDDILSPNFIDAVLPFLSTEEYSIIHFNRLSGNESCSFNHLHDNIFTKSVEEFDFPSFVKRVMSSPNFISSNIFSRQTWEKGSEHYQTSRYFGYGWLANLYFGAIGTKCLYYYFPLVIMRNPPRAWSRKGLLYLIVGMTNIFKDLEKYVPGVGEIWHHRLRYTHFYDMHMLIELLVKERHFYLQYEKEVLEACQSKSERRLVKILLHAPFPKLISKAYPKILKLHRLAHHRCVQQRITDY